MWFASILQVQLCSIYYGKQITGWSSCISEFLFPMDCWLWPWTKVMDLQQLLHYGCPCICVISKRWITFTWRVPLAWFFGVSWSLYLTFFPSDMIFA
jgi:hypothetical protein